MCRTWLWRLWWMCLIWRRHTMLCHLGILVFCSFWSSTSKCVACRGIESCQFWSLEIILFPKLYPFLIGIFLVWSAICELDLSFRLTWLFLSVRYPGLLQRITPEIREYLRRILRPQPTTFHWLHICMNYNISHSVLRQC
jgi:hypothetical protein